MDEHVLYGSNDSHLLIVHFDDSRNAEEFFNFHRKHKSDQALVVFSRENIAVLDSPNHIALKVPFNRYSDEMDKEVSRWADVFKPYNYSEEDIVRPVEPFIGKYPYAPEPFRKFEYFSYSNKINTRSFRYVKDQEEYLKIIIRNNRLDALKMLAEREEFWKSEVNLSSSVDMVDTREMLRVQEVTEENPSIIDSLKEMGLLG